MKKALVIVAGLTMASTSAMASKARLKALGQPENGSSYLVDTRNTFTNPADINGFGDSANFEFGDDGRPATAPAAEGGFTKTVGGFKLGVQLGRTFWANDHMALANAITTGAPGFAFKPANNTVDLVLGGGDAMKFGGALYYGMSKDKSTMIPPATNDYPRNKANTLGLRGGVTSDMFNAYADLALIGNAETETAASTKQKFNQDISFLLGGGFNMGDGMTVFAEFQMDGYTAKTNLDAAKYEYDHTSVRAAFAHVQEMEANTRWFYEAGIKMDNKASKEKVGSTNISKENLLQVPLVLGLETDATSWLALRGSVAQNVLLDEDSGYTKSSHDPNSTTVRAGAGLKFGKLTVDGLLEGSSTETGKINGNTLLSEASLTYMF